MGTDRYWKRADIGTLLYNVKLQNLESSLGEQQISLPGIWIWLQLTGRDNTHDLLYKRVWILSVHDKPLNLAAKRMTASTSLTPPSRQASIWQYCMALAFKNCLNITRFWHISPVATPIPSGTSACKRSNKLFFFKISIGSSFWQLFSTLGL